MSCRQSFEIDLGAFLAEPRSAEFSGFRDHYPYCEACSAEIHAWTELHSELGAAGNARHPEPEDLLRLAESPRTLSSQERTRIENHLRRCDSCRDELTSLQGFEFPTPEARRTPSDPARRRPFGEWLASIRRLLWNPILAYTIAALVIVPTLYTQLARKDGVRGNPTLEVVALDQAVARREAAARPVDDAAGPRADAAVVADDTAGFRDSARPRTLAAEDDLRAEGEVAGKLQSGAARVPTEGPAAFKAVAPRPQAAAEVAPGPQTVLVLTPDASPEVALRGIGSAGLTLRVPRSPSASEPEDVAVHVLSPTGRRELVDYVSAAGSMLEVEVPKGWLTTGRHRVELRSDAGVVQLEFRVSD